MGNSDQRSQGLAKPGGDKARKSALNIVDYAESEFRSFGELPFSSVDSLILSWFSYLRIPEQLAEAQAWEGLRLVDIFRADLFDELYGSLWDVESSARLLRALAANPRFRDIVVKGYREDSNSEKEQQFSAMTLQLTPNLAYIAFRGTDSTLLGWKEDFNLAFLYPVPSQAKAASYLDEAAGSTTGTLLVGGHSKGGNLAVYAAMNCARETAERIERAYSHDGPGFPASVFEDGSFDRIRDSIDKTIPQSSLVGMLLEHQEDYSIVKSDSFSVLQHDPFSWIVEEGAFIPVQTLTPGAKYMDQTLNHWVQSMDLSERETLIDAVYGLLGAAEGATLDDLKANWQTQIPTVLKNISSMDDETRDNIAKAFKELFTLAGQEFPDLLGNLNPLKEQLAALAQIDQIELRGPTDDL